MSDKLIDANRTIVICRVLLKVPMVAVSEITGHAAPETTVSVLPLSCAQVLLAESTAIVTRESSVRSRLLPSSYRTVAVRLATDGFEIGLAVAASPTGARTARELERRMLVTSGRRSCMGAVPDATLDPHGCQSTLMSLLQVFAAPGATATAHPSAPVPLPEELLVTAR